MTAAGIFIILSMILFLCCLLPNYLPDVCNSLHSREELIANYFNLGIAYTEILSFLACFHGINLSSRQLERVLRRKGLDRRKRFSDVMDVITAIEKELSDSGNLIGYCQMHQRLVTDHYLVAKRETVRIILKYLDPDVVNLRL